MNKLVKVRYLPAVKGKIRAAVVVEIKADVYEVARTLQHGKVVWYIRANA